MVEQKDEILLTIFLKHDQTKNLGLDVNQS
jgi:hypothetical protein